MTPSSETSPMPARVQVPPGVQPGQLLEVQLPSFACAHLQPNPASVVAPPMPVAPPRPPGGTMQIFVPPHLPPDRMVTVAAPSGAQMRIQVPDGLQPGQILELRL